MNYRNRTDNKKAFTNQVFKKFTDQCGGDPNEFANILYGRYVVEDFLFSDDYKYHKVLEYFQDKLVPHKVEVFKAGLEVMRLECFKKSQINKDEFLDNLWLHDLSKFSTNESFGYAFHDFSKSGSSIEFKMAWNHHKTHNEHHPEYWFNPNRSGKVNSLPMPEIYIFEMIADWIGAGRTYGNEIDTWLPDNIETFEWHTNTAIRVQTILKELGFETICLNSKLKLI